MRRIARHVGCLLASLLLACEGSGPSPDAQPVSWATDGGDRLAASSAWTVTARLEARDGAYAAPYTALPETLTFSLFVDRTNPASARLVVSEPGAVAGVSGRVDPSGAVAASAAVTLGGNTPTGLGIERVRYDTLTFTPGLGTGAATGEARMASGDVLYARPFAATLAAIPDMQPPSFSVREPRWHGFDGDELHPSDGLELVASEATPPGTTARLVAADGTEVPLDGPPPAEATHGVVRWTAPGPFVPGMTYQVALSPSPVDLAGSRAAALPSATMLAVPFADEDGFESTQVGLASGAAVVTGAAEIPAIAGAKSLLFRPSMVSYFVGRFSARLRVAPGDTVVRARLRAVIEGDSQNWKLYPFTQTLVVTRGKEFRSITLPAPVEPLTELPGPPRRWLGGVTTIEIPLPAGTQDEVMFVTTRVQHCCGPTPPTPGFQLDDLKVE